jgi:predicted RNase H-like HicB family nuclease
VKVVIIATSKEKALRLRVILEKSDEGGYTAYVLSLPGCISQGDTKEKALKNIQEAIGLHLEPSESQ